MPKQIWQKVESVTLYLISCCWLNFSSLIYPLKPIKPSRTSSSSSLEAVSNIWGASHLHGKTRLPFTSSK
uniref:Uncharacterized protein n=1 Tax=Rhizophora mucronata TaxID=61149 RepID=A0A2P2IWX5_RHIMU